MHSDMAPLLCQLADPQAAAPPVPDDQLAALCERAAAHRVGAVVLRKLRGRSGHPAIQALSDSVLPATALTLLLEHHARPIAHALHEQAAPAAIVKGGVFARRLYPRSEDRPWSDIDILAAPEARDAIAAHLHAMGYRLVGRERSRQRSLEEKWHHPDVPNLLIELHGNLVHYPALRRRVNFGFAELMKAGAQDPEAPLALFAIAVVHATLGHKLNELRLLVDALQAFRALDAADRAALPSRMAALSLRLEAGLVLRLIGALFDLPEAREAALRVDPSRQGRVAAAIIRPRDVLIANGPRLRASHLRRHAFRLLQTRHLGR